ncbi:BEM_collapsed_G0045510.mRNA.1.CDS.1 [Saccharomyces cerevisiae]|nr:BEM_collapsed_G0045510.mRNA.1.CDS.1 [Saccharomyces cerevisiae]
MYGSRSLVHNRRATVYPKGKSAKYNIPSSRSFQLIPSKPFSIKHNSNSVATISLSDKLTNNFHHFYSEKSSEDITTTFSFLTLAYIRC